MMRPRRALLVSAQPAAIPRPPAGCKPVPVLNKVCLYSFSLWESYGSAVLGGSHRKWSRSLVLIGKVPLTIFLVPYANHTYQQHAAQPK